MKVLMRVHLSTCLPMDFLSSFIQLLIYTNLLIFNIFLICLNILLEKVGVKLSKTLENKCGYLCSVLVSLSS